MVSNCFLDREHCKLLCGLFDRHLHKFVSNIVSLNKQSTLKLIIAYKNNIIKYACKIGHFQKVLIILSKPEMFIINIVNF